MFLKEKMAHLKLKLHPELVYSPFEMDDQDKGH